MSYIYDNSAPKKPTNLTVNSDLLAKAKHLKLNLSATLEHALLDEVRKVERKEWVKKNRSAINAANRFTEEKGLFSDAYRIL